MHAEIERFNSDVQVSPLIRKAIIGDAVRLDDIVVRANAHGYVFSQDEVRTYIREQAQDKIKQTDLTGIMTRHGYGDMSMSENMMPVGPTWTSTSVVAWTMGGVFSYAVAVVIAVVVALAVATPVNPESLAK